MPRKHVFLYLWCAGTDITENKQKPGKTGTRVWKVQKADAGKHFSRPNHYSSSKCHNLPLKNQSWSRLALGYIFQNGRNYPWSFKMFTIGPCSFHDAYLYKNLPRSITYTTAQAHHQSYQSPNHLTTKSPIPFLLTRSNKTNKYKKTHTAPNFSPNSTKTQDKNPSLTLPSN
jgi:hypothetical protein